MPQTSARAALEQGKNSVAYLEAACDGAREGRDRIARGRAPPARCFGQLQSETIAHARRAHGLYEYFVRQGHPVYVPDQVGRARSGASISDLQRGSGRGSARQRAAQHLPARE